MNCVGHSLKLIPMLLALLSVLGLFVMTGALHGPSAGIHCDDDVSALMDKCRGILEKMVIKESLLMDPEKLKRKYCRHYVKGTNCMKSSKLRCNFDVLSKLTKPLQNFITNFCDDESMFVQEYRRGYTRCYKKILPDEYDVCNKAEIPTSPMERLQDEPREQDVCCLFVPVINCKQELIRDRCSEEDASFVKVIYKRLLESKVNCELYFNDQALCPDFSPKKPNLRLDNFDENSIPFETDSGIDPDAIAPPIEDSVGLTPDNQLHGITLPSTADDDDLSTDLVDDQDESLKGTGNNNAAMRSTVFALIVVAIRRFC